MIPGQTFHTAYCVEVDIPIRKNMHSTPFHYVIVRNIYVEQGQFIYPYDIYDAVHFMSMLFSLVSHL